MHEQLRREIFSIFTSLTLIFQYVLGIFLHLPAPVYAANPSADLDQWGNEAPVGWQDGALNGNQADYFEGDSVPYRLKFGNLSVGSSYWVTIEWDTTKGNDPNGKHALDYLTSFNATETTDPCSGIIGCGSPDTEAIPDDPNSSVTQVPGNFTLYNGVITGLSPYTMSGSYTGTSSTSITISFTPSVSDPVLAWGGHIGSQVDWGVGNSAVGISGSPYHMRLINLGLTGEGGSGGNQDRALSAAAIIPPGYLTIAKDVVPDDASQWDFQVTGPDGYSSGTTLGDGSSTVFIVNPGAYTASETTSPSYSTSVSCDTGESGSSSVDVDISSEEFVTCTFVNTIENGSITVDKVVFPSESTQSFDFTLSGVDPDSATLTGADAPHTFSNLLPGTYSLTEEAVEGWDLTDAYCNDGSVLNEINISAGENISCTFINTQRGQIVVEKVTVPSGSSEEFTFNPSWGLGFSLTDGGSETSAYLEPGTYSVSEDLDEDWLTSISCSDESDPSLIDLSAGETVTCTFTNYKLPTLTVVKSLFTDDGGDETVEDFDLYLDGDPAIWGTSYILGVGEHNFFELDPEGYAPSFSEGCEGGSVSLEYGDETVCTITNDDIAPQLTVIKHVVNDDGGAAVAGDFTMNVSGTDVSNSSFPGDENGTTVTLDAGSYSVTENDLSGYSDSYSADCSGTIDIGQTKTCTITNDDQQSYVVVNKTVINENGGSAQPNDFLLTVDDEAAFDEVAVPVNPGLHIVGETNLPGYTAGSWGEDCGSNGEVTVALGETRTCTITNDDQPGTLHVVKVLPNDDGGTAIFEQFSFSVNDGDAVAFETDGQNDLTVNSGTYSIIETNPMTGYTLSYDNCSNVAIPNGGEATCIITNDDQPGTLIVQKIVDNEDGGDANGSDFYFQVNDGETTGPFLDDGALKEISVPQGTYTVTEESADGYGTSYDNCEEVFIPNGGSETCIVTNDDIAPTITLIKEVINDNGGTAEENDFGLTIGDASVDSDETLEVDANTSYTLDEAGLFGYEFVSISGEGCPEELGGSVTLNEGESLTCTITNDDVAPQLTVIKRVVNNSTGTAVAGDFTILVSGLGVSESVFAGNENGVTVTLDAGQYLVSELPAAGYTVSYSTDCDGTIGVGETKTCTVTNSDQDVLGEDTEEGEVLGTETLPQTGASFLGFALAFLALSLGVSFRRKSFSKR